MNCCINIVLETITVYADKNKLTQVISNLLSNAIKFTKKGTIIVTEDVKDGKALVSINDTGQGIDPEIMPRLFDKFASRSFHGTGIGLFISKGIIEAHGGKIWAENHADGEGATFHFALSVLKNSNY
ncbi:MAG: HAMP domain-containing sensor histidine kinase [Candidatus Nitrosopolaris sp.]